MRSNFFRILAFVALVFMQSVYSQDPNFDGKRPPMGPPPGAPKEEKVAPAAAPVEEEDKVPESVEEITSKKVELRVPEIESKLPEVKAIEIVKEAEAAAQSNKNYKPDTCVWAEDIPRKIVQGSSCSIEGSRICIGYVVCEQREGGGKFTRMSTCSEGLCGEDAAVACTKQGGYGSFKPKPEKSEFVSKKIDDVLRGSVKGE